MGYRPAPFLEKAAVAIAAKQKEAPETAPGVVVTPEPAEPGLGPTPPTAALVVAPAAVVAAAVVPRWHCRAVRRHSAAEQRQLDLTGALVAAVPAAAGLVE